MVQSTIETEFVHHGLWSPWIDYSRSGILRSQILVSDYYSQILTSWIAVCLTLASPSIFRLLAEAFRATLRFAIWTYRRSKPETFELVPLREFTDWDNDNPESVAQYTLKQLETIRDESEPFHGLRKLKDCHWISVAFEDENRSLRERLSFFFTALNGDARISLAFGLVTIFLFSAFVGTTIGGIASARIADGELGLSNSPNCGNWLPKFTQFNESLLNGLNVHFEKEIAAGTYQETCYGPDAKSDTCKTFSDQEITYAKKYNVSCPFEGSVCLEGDVAAIKFDTGLIDSEILGINIDTAKRFKFQRSMTCAPLLVDDRYVSRGQEGRHWQWHYRYGPVSPRRHPLTSKNPGDWSSSMDLGTNYQLRSVGHDPKYPNLGFQPRAGFGAGSQIVTIFFISSNSRIVHMDSRRDPIFPAQKSVKIPSKGGMTTFWRNNSTRAGVLGCADDLLICDATGRTCWNNSNYTSALRTITDPDTRDAFYLLKIALDDSSAMKAVLFRAASALNASRKLNSIYSMRLAENQWEVESEIIFRTSLARMQVNVLDFARGTYAHYPGVQNHAGDEVRGACGMVIFQTTGYTNVSTAGFWGLNALCIVLFLSSRRYSNARKRRKAREDNRDPGYQDYLWIAIFWMVFFWSWIKPIMGYLRSITYDIFRKRIASSRGCHMLAGTILESTRNISRRLWRKFFKR